MNSRFFAIRTKLKGNVNFGGTGFLTYYSGLCWVNSLEPRLVLGG